MSIARETSAAARSEKERKTKIFLSGDVMTGRGIDQVLPRPSDPLLHEWYVQSALDYVRLAEEANGPIEAPVDFAYIWCDALIQFERQCPDLRLINLETAITRSETFEAKGVNYRMSPDNLPCLTAAGNDVCALANNHMLDWGRAGLTDTLDLLQQAGIKTAGAGPTICDARAPAIIRFGDHSRVLAFAAAMERSGVLARWAASVKRSSFPVKCAMCGERLAVGKGFLIFFRTAGRSCHVCLVTARVRNGSIGSAHCCGISRCPIDGACFQPVKQEFSRYQCWMIAGADDSLRSR